MSLARIKSRGCGRKSEPVLNAFTAPACKVSGLKSAYTYTPANKSTFNTVQFDRNRFMCSYEGGTKKSLKDFKFGTFIGRFKAGLYQGEVVFKK